MSSLLKQIPQSVKGATTGTQFNDLSERKPKVTTPSVVKPEVAAKQEVVKKPTGDEIRLKGSLSDDNLNIVSDFFKYFPRAVYKAYLTSKIDLQQTMGKDIEDIKLTESKPFGSDLLARATGADKNPIKPFFIPKTLPQKIGLSERTPGQEIAQTAYTDYGQGQQLAESLGFEKDGKEARLFGGGFVALGMLDLLDPLGIKGKAKTQSVRIFKELGEKYGDDVVEQGFKLAYKSDLPDNLSPLIQEARKYKSAEEFMKAQGTPVYHGTRQPLREGKGLFSLTKDKSIAENYSQAVGGGRTGVKNIPELQGAYLYDDFWKFNKEKNVFEFNGKTKTRNEMQELANRFEASAKFKGARVDEYFIDPNVKILDLTNKSGIDEILSLSTKGNKGAEKILSNTKLNNTFDWGATKSPEQLKAFNEILLPQLEAKGFGGVNYFDDIGKTTAVFDTKSLRTKSQLEEIWNQMNKDNNLAKLIQDNPSQLKVEIEKSIKNNATEISRLLGKDPAEIFQFSQKFSSADELSTRAIASNFNKKGTVKQEVRFDKLNLPDEQIFDIERRINALGLDTRTVKTFDDMEKAALDLGTTPQSLLKETASNRITSDQVVALRSLINTNSQFIVNTKKQLLDLQIPTEERRILQYKLGQAESQLSEALSKLIKGGTEAGRAVVAFRIQAKNNLEPEFWLREAAKQLNTKEISDEVRNTVLDTINKKDINALANFVASLKKASNTEKAIALWKAGLLTAPTTQLANYGGNITMSILMDSSKFVATTLDVGVSLFTGKRTITTNPSIIVKKVASIVSGIADIPYTGMTSVVNKLAGRDLIEKKSLTEVGNYMRTGVYSQNLVKKWDLPYTVNFNNKLLDVYTKSVFRSLGAGDIIFRRAAIEESLEQQAIIIAKNEGLKGVAYRNRIKELLLEPTNSMTLNAIDTGEYATFQSDNVLSSMISSMKNVAREKSQVAFAATELVAPFTKTPTNIAARIAEFSPLGFANAMFKFIGPDRNQKEIVESLSRAVTGTGILGLGYYLANKGLMTGSIPVDPSERDQFFAEGKQPNSIYLFGGWRRLNRISPFGNLMSIGAEIEQTEVQGTANKLKSSGFIGIRNLTEQTFLKGASGALQAVVNPDRNADKFIDTLAASFVPSIIGRTEGTIDPTIRETEGMVEAIRARLPYFSESLPAKRDVFGNIAEIAGGRFNLIDPFSSTTPKDDPVLKEAREVEAFIGLPSKSMSGYTLNNKEYSLYQKVQGRILKLALSQLIESDEYKGFSKTEKADEIKNVTRQVRTELNKVMFLPLMITRYNLPSDTNPKLVSELLKTLADNEKFVKSSTKEQEAIIKRLLDSPNLIQQ